MPLENVFTMALPNNTLGGAAHGLVHEGVSRTPDFCIPMASAGNTAVSFYNGMTMTWDSVTFTIGTGTAALGVTIQVFAKRCHSIEDRTGAL